MISIGDVLLVRFVFMRSFINRWKEYLIYSTYFIGMHQFASLYLFMKMPHYRMPLSQQMIIEDNKNISLLALFSESVSINENVSEELTSIIIWSLIIIYLFLYL